MTFGWDVAAAMAWIVGITLAVVVLAMHVRGLRRSMRSATYQALVQARAPFHEMVAQYPYIHRVLFEGEDLADLDEDARVRVIQAWTLLMSWHESVLLHRQAGTITDTTAQQWATLLRRQMGGPAFRALWNEHGWSYHPALRMVVSVEARTSVLSG
jgi:hypothetical protein